MKRTLYDVWAEKTSTANKEGLVKFVFTYKYEMYFSEWINMQWTEPILIEEL